MSTNNLSDSSNNTGNHTSMSSSDGERVMPDKKDIITFSNHDPKYFPPIPRSNFQKNLLSRFITYRIERDNNVTWKGFRYHFQISLYGEPLYHTKTKSKKPTGEIFISAGTDMHFSQKSFDAVLLANDQKSLFSLRKNTDMGQELMTVEVLSYSKKLPRETILNVFEPMEFVPSRVHSMKPKLCHNGYQLSFLGKPAVPSIKNCILIGEDEMPYFLIRKTCQSVVEIDAPQIFPPLDVFGLALAVWFS